MNRVIIVLISILGAVSLVAQGNDSAKLTPEELQEVEVLSAKSSFRLEGNKRVFDVGKNIESIGGSAEDVIRNMPTVDIDVNGTVSYRGESPAIFVDGKPSDMSLDEIPSSDIKQIELISVPSAKYDASTSGGILNIVLKKERQKGLRGTATVYIDRFPRFRGGGNINYGYKKWNIGLRGFAGTRKNVLENTTNRTVTQNGVPIQFSSSGTGDMNVNFLFLSPSIRLQANKRTEISLNGRTFWGQFFYGDKSTTATDSAELAILHHNTVEDRVSDNNGTILFTRIQLGIDKKLRRNPKSSWNLQLRYQQGLVDRPTFLNILQYDELRTTTQSSSKQRTSNVGYFRSAIASFDMELSLPNNKKIELGAQARLVGRAFDIDFFQDEKRVANKSSSYTNWESINAVYGSFSQTINKRLSYQVGLRLENSLFRADIKDQIAYVTDYPLEFFPTAFVQYEFSNKGQLQFSYARKIRRPHGIQTTPITDYTDPLNIARGNPSLRPAFTNLLELTYNMPIAKRNSNLLVSLYWKNVDGLVTTFYQKEETVDGLDAIIRTPYNSGTLHTYGVEITPLLSLASWYTITPNINLLYSQIILDNGLEKIDVANLSYFVKLNQEFKLGKNYTIQLRARYRSRSVVPPNSGGGDRSGSRLRPTINTTVQGYIEAAFDMSIGFQKSWKKKWFLSVNVRDIFGSNYYRVYTHASSLEQSSSLLRNPFYASVSIRYMFGKNTRKQNGKEREPIREEQDNGF